MKKNLVITQNNIDNGKRSTSSCPIALSIQSMYPGAIVSVASRGLYSAFARVIYNNKSAWSLEFGADAARFIICFDAGKKVYPCVLDFVKY